MVVNLASLTAKERKTFWSAIYKMQLAQAEGQDTAQVSPGSVLEKPRPPTFEQFGLTEKRYRSSSWPLSPTRRAKVQYEEALAVYERELAEYDRSVEAKAEWDLALKASHWRSLDGFAFEREMANLFREMGYRVATTPRTGDGGVDLVLMNGTEKTVVQCKAHNTKIPIGTLRELSAVRDDFGADRAILACFEGVTKPCSAPGSLDTSLSHAAGLIEIAACHA